MSGGLSGDAGRDMVGLSLVGLAGETRGRVRELEDLGERTVDGFARLVGPAGLVRFFGAGMSRDGSGVFSLSSLPEISSLCGVRDLAAPHQGRDI